MGTRQRRFIEAIKSHDRIIMMGHGTYFGLIEPTSKRLIITPQLVYLLREKLCVGIWCHANLFFEKYKLKGIYTGMIISEIVEAYEFDVRPVGKQLAESNGLFALTMKEFVGGEITLDEAIEQYRNYEGENNPANKIVKMKRKEMLFLLHLMMPNLIIEDKYVDKQFNYDKDSDSFKLQFHASQGWSFEFCIFEIYRNLDLRLHYYVGKGGHLDMKINNQIATRKMLDKYTNIKSK